LKRYRHRFYNFKGDGEFIDIDFAPLIQKYIEQDERKPSDIISTALQLAFNGSGLDRIDFLIKIGMFKNRQDVIRYAVTTYMNKTKRIVVSGSEKCLYY
jgi:hypothetical protein